MGGFHHFGLRRVWAPLVWSSLCACSSRPLYLSSTEPAPIGDAAVNPNTDASVVPDANVVPDAAVVPDAGSDQGSDAATTLLPYDTCAAPLDVSAGGTFLLDIGDAHGDYPQVLVPLLCGGVVGDSCRDVVATFHLDEARDVALLADTGVGGHVAIALRTTCDEQGPPVDVARGYGPTPLRHRALPAGTYFVFLGADPPDAIILGGPTPSPLTNLELDVAFSPVTQAPANETCATPFDLGAGGHFEGSFVDVQADVMACQLSNPDLVYSFTLSQDSNVHVQADSDGFLQLTVRSNCGAGSFDDCFLPTGPSGGPRILERTYYDLPAGRYFLILEDWAHREPDFTLDVAIAPGTPAPRGDTCSDPIPIQVGVPFSGSLAQMQADVYACGIRERDAIHQVTLSEQSDVWIQAQGGNQSLQVGLLSSCNGTSTNPGHCNGGALGQAATYLPTLAAGTYTVVVGSEDVDAYELSVEAWPTPQVTPISVAGNESCDTAFEVPPEGGVFVGTTAAALDDTTPTACGASAGGLDVAFLWTTPVARRVFVTTSGSAFAATIEMRDAQCGELDCDGWSGEGGTWPAGALDLMLQPGSYIFVVDGLFSSARGAYRFELRPL